MATTKVISPSSAIIRRTAPMVEKCFRNGTLFRAEPSAAAALSPSPQLALIMPFVAAKEKVAHLLVDLWRSRGFDTLLVETPYLDCFLSNKIMEGTTARVADYLQENDQYKIIGHGISAGTYLLQRLFINLQDTEVKCRITHQILESYTNYSGYQSGLLEALPPKYRGLLQPILRLYERVGAYELYKDTQAHGETTPPSCPALFMHSLGDRVSKYEYITKTIENFSKTKPVYEFLLPEELKVDHVTLLRHMGQESYMSCIMRFLRQTNFSPVRPSILQEEDPAKESARINIERTRLVVPNS